MIITQEQLQEARQLRASGYTYEMLADKYDIAMSTIYKYINFGDTSDTIGRPRLDFSAEYKDKMDRVSYLRMHEGYAWKDIARIIQTNVNTLHFWRRKFKKYYPNLH